MVLRRIGNNALHCHKGSSDQFSISLAFRLPGNQDALLQA